MWYQKLLLSLCAILLGILLYLQLKPKEQPADYKKEFDSIQVRIDSVYGRLNYEKEQADAFVVVREYYKETQKIEKEQVQNLPLDSAVSLLRKNMINYEKIDFSTPTNMDSLK